MIKDECLCVWCTIGYGERLNGSYEDIFILYKDSIPFLNWLTSMSSYIDELLYWWIWESIFVVLIIWIQLVSLVVFIIDFGMICE